MMTWTTGHLVWMTVGFCCFINIVRCNFIDIGVKYKITLDVFSGRDDPDWDIDENDELYQRVAWAVNSGPPTELEDELGYRGFIVKATNIFGQMAWKTIGRHSNEDLENALLNSCPYGRIDNIVRNEVTNGIRGGIDLPDVYESQNYVLYQPINIIMNKNGNTIRHTVYVPYKNRRTKRQAPNVPGAPNVGTGFNRAGRVCSVRFEPDVWNISPIREKNNCYNYATNRRTDTFAQPGRGSGNKFNKLEVPDVHAACVRDGLRELTGPDAGRDCLIALVIWPGQDFHFYRLDYNGFWSHKSGQTRARDTDDSGNKITNPLTSDNGPYVDFGGFLGVPENIRIN